MEQFFQTRQLPSDDCVNAVATDETKVVKTKFVTYILDLKYGKTKRYLKDF